MDKVQLLPEQSSMHFLQGRGVDGDIGLIEIWKGNSYGTSA